jgi:hypothetical protein
MVHRLLDFSEMAIGAGAPPYNKSITVFRYYTLHSFGTRDLRMPLFGFILTAHIEVSYKFSFGLLRRP